MPRADPCPQVCRRSPFTAAQATLATAPTGDIPVVTPIYQSVNYVQESGAAEGLRYPRYGNTPNAEVVQRRLAQLEGAEASLVLG